MTWASVNELAVAAAGTHAAVMTRDLLSLSTMLQSSGLDEDRVTELLLVEVEEGTRLGDLEYAKLTEPVREKLDADARDATLQCMVSAAHDLWRSAVLLGVDPSTLDPTHVALAACKLAMTGEWSR